jgi:hypothetical protein
MDKNITETHNIRSMSLLKHNGQVAECPKTVILTTRCCAALDSVLWGQRQGFNRGAHNKIFPGSKNGFSAQFLAKRPF